MSSFHKLVVATLLISGAFISPALAAGWKAGSAKIKITPEQPMWMAGYGSRNHPSTGLLNDLYAKALVIEDGQSNYATLITLDLVGIDRSLAMEIRQDVAEAFHLPIDSIALCCSHTHSGPVVGKNLRTLHYDLVDAAQQKLIDDYATALPGKIVALVETAMKALVPSEISWGSGTATFATNRRNNKEPDVPQLRADGKLVGPFDHDVPVLKVTDAQGKLTAVLFGYACHATVLDGYDWSSDYPGFAQAELEKSHPGCTALFFAGCGADQNPLPRRKVELASQYGSTLAAAVDDVLKQSLKPVSGELQTGQAELPLELAHVPTREELEVELKSMDRYVAARAKRYMADLDAGRSLPGQYAYPVQIFQLGAGPTLIMLGGEVVVDYALALKQEYGSPQTWVAGYSNDVMAYIPSRRVLAEGGYEGAGAMVYYGLPSPWQPTIETNIRATVRGLVQTMRQEATPR